MLNRRKLAIGALIFFGITGLIYAVAAFYFPYQSKKDLNYAKFEAISETIIKEIEVTLNSAYELLLGLKALYGASTFVTREEFQSYTEKFLELNPSITAIEWIPKVPYDLREKYEAEGRKILPNFTFTEKNKEGKLVKAGKKEVYYPVYYIEPFQRNLNAWGFDVTSSPEREKALFHAQNTGEYIASSAIKLIQAKKNPEGFITFMPIYNTRTHTNTHEKRIQNLEGFVLGVFSFFELCYPSLEARNLSDSLQLIISINGKEVYTIPKAHKTSSLSYSRSFDYGGGSWSIKISPIHSAFHPTPPMASYVLGIGSLLAGILVVCYVWTTTSRAEKIERYSVSRATELDVAKEIAEKANQMKSRYLAILSHEFKNPLNAIIGLSKLLADEAPEHKDTIKHIQTSGEHLLEIVNTTVNLTDIEADHIEFLPEKFDLNKLVQDSCDILSLSAQNKSLSIEVNFDQQTLEIISDPQKIRQVIVNLISNAIKYTEKGTVTISTKSESNKAYIVVKDTGRGIPEETLATLFEPYTQAGGSLEEKYIGSGLGLWISKKFTKVCQGTIEAQSEVGKGSTFRVVLPLSIRYEER